MSSTDGPIPLDYVEYVSLTSGVFTTEQHGAALLLLLHYWHTDKLPTDLEGLSNIVLMSTVPMPQFETFIIPILATFFIQDESGLWVNPTLEKLRKGIRSRSRKGLR
jgi:uncharacterized protein YdaU (DUF1376 family)